MKSNTAAPANEVKWIYNRLIRSFGRQGWWPVSGRSRRPRYSPRWTYGRLTAQQQFEVAVGAILTQNTAWTNVEKALAELSGVRCLSPEKLARIRLPRLYRLIRSSGYFRQKAKRLQGFSRYLVERWNGRLDKLLEQDTASARQELLALNGIGPETADSILLYAGRHPIFVVDAYTRRIGNRFGLFRTEDYDAVQKQFMESLPPDVPAFREYHALLVELAKRHCRKQSACNECPVRSRCTAGRRF